MSPRVFDMNWFHRFCRESGLMIHDIVKPLKSSKREVNRTVEEKKVSDKVTLRRTTIDEIEITPGQRDDNQTDV